MSAPITPEEIEQIRNDKRRSGLYGKYEVRRTDGKDFEGQKHFGCDYFVLDLSHDPYAAAAIRAYAEACRNEYPNLAGDLKFLADTNSSAKSVIAVNEARRLPHA